MNPTANVRHAIKMQWDWSVPIGRGRRVRHRHEPGARLRASAAGSSTAPAACRRARVNFGNVRLVGMTVDELTEALQVRGPSEPDDRDADGVRAAPGHHPQHAPRVQPQLDDGDRLLGPRRTGRTVLRAGERSRLHPAARGRLRARTLLVRAPLFTRFDIGLTKRFPIKSQVNFELRFDMLNVFDNINFLPHATAATTRRARARTSSATASAYRTSTTSSTRRPARADDVPVELVVRVADRYPRFAARSSQSAAQLLDVSGRARSGHPRLRSFDSELAVQ